MISVHQFQIAQQDSSPLKLYISIQLISNLLQALAKLLVFRVEHSSSTQLCPGHCSVSISMPLNSLVDETTQGETERIEIKYEIIICLV